MPLRSLCCCRADEAVIEQKALPVEDGTPQIALSDVSSVSLAYIDAVAEEKDWEDPIAFQRASTSEIFFDAADEGEEAFISADKSISALSAPAKLAAQKKNVEGDEDDEHLLEPAYRSDATAGHRKRINPLLAGFPGHLTPSQLKSYQELRSELKKRGAGVYQEMVYSYSDLEPESYALCRYLRNHNFHVNKVFSHMDHNAERWKDAAKRNFYPSVVDAVGAPLSVLLTQFPSLYYGLSKEGYPCCYFNAAGLSVEGIECVTDCDLLPNVIWYNMMHDLKYNKFPESKRRHPDLKKLGQLTILNLKGLSKSLFTSKMYHTLQQVDAVANVWPEMLHCLVIINAPGFFSFFWSVISRLLDAKTSSLIEIYSSPEKGRHRLLELIDETELPSDYGGNAMSTADIILREGRKGKVPLRQIVELIHVRKTEQKVEFHLEPQEKAVISIYTRSTAHAIFTVQNEQGGEVHKRELQMSEAGRLPTCFDFGHEVEGPGKFSILAYLEQSSGKHHFLLIGEIFEKGM